MEAVTHLEKVIVGEVSAVTHIEKVIAGETSAVTYTEKVITGEAPPITHLQKVIAGEASPVTHLEHIWAGGSPTPTEHEYTGAVPVTFTADGTPLLDFLISGNEEHSGTPTPQNPITPEGCGDLETAGTKAGQYKIPISSASTTTPVYLGEVQTTRKIKKLVLTGEETAWTKASSAKVFYLWQYDDDALNSANIISCMCSHYSAQGNVVAVSGVENLKCCFRTTAQTFYIHDDAFESKTDFVTYLQQQYANGTPVTVWYVLAEPTTGIVNEPLLKIGDYADTLSMEQAGVSIPTNNGSTTIDVETTVKPSEVYIKYKGV